MKQFYGQMTKDELKGVVYSGDHMQEFADMCESTGCKLHKSSQQITASMLVSVSYSSEFYGFYPKYFNGLTETIQWQPEPDTDLVKIVEMCGGVWPDQAIKGVIRAWKEFSTGGKNNPDSVFLSNNAYKGQRYNREQFEAAKVYVERNKFSIDDIDGMLDQRVIAENLERILKNELEWCIKFGAYEREEIKWFGGSIYRIWYEKFCNNPANRKPLNGFVEVAKELLDSTLNKQELVTISTKDSVGIYNIATGEKMDTDKTTVFGCLQEVKSAIKNGSWINIKGLTEEQAQYCIDWLAERTGREALKASKYITGCAGYYKNCTCIQAYPCNDEHLEIKASDILPKDKPQLKTDQSVYTEYGSELTVYRVDEDKGVLCSDLQWYSADDLITDEKVIAVYQDMIKLSKGVIKSSMVSNKEEVMQLAKALIADSSFEILLK